VKVLRIGGPQCSAQVHGAKTTLYYSCAVMDDDWGNTSAEPGHQQMLPEVWLVLLLFH